MLSGDFATGHETKLSKYANLFLYFNTAFQIYIRRRMLTEAAEEPVADDELYENFRVIMLSRPRYGRLVDRKVNTAQGHTSGMCYCPDFLIFLL
jgi:hypothetical protein